MAGTAKPERSRDADQLPPEPLGRSSAEALPRFHLRAGSAVEQLPDCVLLFSQAEQRIHELNPSSAVLAETVRDGASVAELESALAGFGVDEGDAAAWVDDFLVQMSRLGLLEAEQACVSAQPIEQQILVAGLALRLRYASHDLAGSIAPAFDHLRTESVEPESAYQVSAGGGFILIGKDGARAVVVEPSLAAVWLKGAILEDVLARPDHLCALHAGCMARDGKAALILGSPGAGKTTLCLGLLREGFSYCSDDVTLVREGGEVCGVPLAPAVKEGAWGLLRPVAPDLDRTTVHLRPDGQRVRFLPLGAEQVAPVARVSTIVTLHRSPGQEATVEPMSSKEALTELLRESRSADGNCSPPIFEALARLVAPANCVRLKYAEAADAVPLLSCHV